MDLGLLEQQRVDAVQRRQRRELLRHVAHREPAPAGWRIYDVNVLGVWLVENYRSSFAQEIGAGGIDGLIAKLVDLNSKAASGKG